MDTSQLFLNHIRPSDCAMNKKVDALLQQEGLVRDPHIDGTVVLQDSDGNVYATGSYFQSTLRCIAVDERLQGTGAAATIISELVRCCFAAGHMHLFLYTRCKNISLFTSMGFFEVARTETVAFLENKRNGLAAYIQRLKNEIPYGSGERNAAIVMNANPFTLGHQYLIEEAAAKCDILHVFVVAEDVSVFPRTLRTQMVIDGTKHLPNVVVHTTENYMISCATFPSYFLKKPDVIVESHAELDAAVFLKIAKEMHIRTRFVGQEPNDPVTAVYNTVLHKRLVGAGLTCKELARKMQNAVPISASDVRKHLSEGDLEYARSLVPDTTWNLLQKDEGQAVIQRLRCGNKK